MGNNNYHDDGADFPLAMIDPRADCCVMTNVLMSESMFIRGESLRQNWEHPTIQRVHTTATPVSVNPDNPWHRVRCPDWSILFVKFLSPEHRLLEQQPEPSRIENENDMSDTKKKPAPPTKKKPAAEAKPVAAPAASKSAKPSKPPKAQRQPGPGEEWKYWLRERVQTAASKQLGTAANRSTIREGLSTAKTFTDTVKFLERAQLVGPSQIDPKLQAFLDQVFEDGKMIVKA